MFLVWFLLVWIGSLILNFILIILLYKVTHRPFKNRVSIEYIINDLYGRRDIEFLNMLIFAPIINVFPPIILFFLIIGILLWDFIKKLKI